MKVVEIYSKNDLDRLIYNGRSISQIMDDFFRRFPIVYRKNYDKNLSTLEMWKVDEDVDGLETSHYYPNHNLLTFQQKRTLPHEFMHMGSFDRDAWKMAFLKDVDDVIFESALVEGMAEYLASIALGSAPYNYFVECFVIAMLSNIDGIFEPFFIPSYDNFIKLFPNRKDIYSLMYSLDYYHEKIMIIEECSKDDVLRVKRAIGDTIDGLIDIELSFHKSFSERKGYADKFMDLIVGRDIRDFICDVFPDYKDYAFGQVKKRVLGRK